ncbi:MAG: hypothetical protein HY929_06450 [Euryarchaeota archaeon]|nr:hypothetical protein [Euryarchaeota archaeon]
MKNRILLIALSSCYLLVVAFKLKKKLKVKAVNFKTIDAGCHISSCQVQPMLCIGSRRPVVAQA